MSVKPLPPVRRIVTGLRADGSSYFVADGPTPALLKVPERPGYSCENLWRTSGPVTRIDEPESVLQQRGVAPPRQGTVIRTLDIPPEAKDPAERARLAAELAQVEAELDKATARLSDASFTARAPEDVVTGSRERAAELAHKAKLLTETLERRK